MRGEEKQMKGQDMRNSSMDSVEENELYDIVIHHEDKGRRTVSCMSRNISHEQNNCVFMFAQLFNQSINHSN